MGSKHVAMRDRKFLLQSGLYVGCVSLVSGVAVLATGMSKAMQTEILRSARSSGWLERASVGTSSGKESPSAAKKINEM